MRGTPTPLMETAGPRASWQTSPPRSTFAAVDALKAMIGSMERIALLFGWLAPGQTEELGATIDHIDNELSLLHRSRSGHGDLADMLELPQPGITCLATMSRAI